MNLCGDDKKAEENKTKEIIHQASRTKREKEICADMEQLTIEREKIKTNKTWLCPHCNKRTQIKKLTIIDAYHYIRPYSCTGGDYWSFSNEYYVVCIKCDSAVRSYIGTYDFSTPYFDMSEEDQTRITGYYFLDDYHYFFGEHLKLYETSGTSIDLDKLRKEKKDRKERNEL